MGGKGGNDNFLVDNGLSSCHQDVNEEEAFI
jgi:hypothetical protein